MVRFVGLVSCALAAAVLCCGSASAAVVSSGSEAPEKSCESTAARERLASGGKTLAQEEQLREENNSTRLPDCRVYEMVTPPYKEGYPILAAPGSSYSDNGEQAILGTLGNLAGTEGSGAEADASIYAARRDTEGGWSLSSLSPSGARFARGLIVSVEVNSGASLWEQHELDQPASDNELYARAPSGVFSLIGKVSPPPPVGREEEPSNQSTLSKIQAVAATANYSHVVLSSANPEGRWPFDEIAGNGSSLYEYSGINGSSTPPTLVAVTGEKGTSDVKGFECGATLGGLDSESTYNALSSDGETIFFTPLGPGYGPGCRPSAQTPPSVEVWARLHGGRTSAEPAKTIDVSARSDTQCSGSCATSAESAKLFQGASENGQKVFFTSTQQLLNAAGEGSNNLYEYEFGAADALKLVASNVMGVARISEDGSRVYFVSGDVLTTETDSNHMPAKEGDPNLYVYNTDLEQLESHGFIGTFSESDQADWGGFDNRPVETAPRNGQYLVFASSAPELTPDDAAKAPQIFEYDALSGELVRVSKAENGSQALAEDGNAAKSSLGESEFALVDFQSTSDHEGGLASNGLTVAFSSAGRLSPYASASERNCSSVYEFRTAGAVDQGSVHLISDGVDTQPYKGIGCGAKYIGMDETGNNILFVSADPLLPSDSDGTQVDIYDARVDGGFPVTHSEATRCGGGEMCGNAGSAMTPFLGAPPPSALQSAEGSSAANQAASSGASTKRHHSTADKMQRLKRALRACRAKRRGRRRALCEVKARTSGVERNTAGVRREGGRHE